MSWTVCPARRTRVNAPRLAPSGSRAEPERRRSSAASPSSELTIASSPWKRVRSTGMGTTRSWSSRTESPVGWESAPAKGEARSRTVLGPSSFIVDRKRAASDVTATEEFVVAAILPDESPGNDFNLTPNPAAPLNVFVPLRSLARLASGDRDPIANVLLASGQKLDDLDASLRDAVANRGLRAQDPRDRPEGLPERRIGSTDSALGHSGRGDERGEGPGCTRRTDNRVHRGCPRPWQSVDTLPRHCRSEPDSSRYRSAPSSRQASLHSLTMRSSCSTGRTRNSMACPIGSKIRLDYFNPEVEGTGELRTVELSLRGYVPPRRSRSRPGPRRRRFGA